MVVGGSATNGPLNDVYVSTDGQGKMWTQATSVPSGGGFNDAATVALYDSAAITGGSQTYSTVLVAPSDAYTTNSIFASTDLGTTWTVLAAQPWTYRSRNDMTADADNYVYATGGLADGSVYFSWNGGKAWTVLQQLSSSSVWSNTVVYTSSHDNCQFISYTANANSPNGFHKTLIVYGGGTTTANVGVITVSTPSPNCTKTSDATVVFGELLLPCEVACGYNATCPTGVSCAAVAPGSSSSAGSSAGVATSSTGSAATAARASSSSTVVVVPSSAASTATNGASSSSTGSSPASSSSTAPPAPVGMLSSSSSSSSSTGGSPPRVNAAQHATSATVITLAAVLSIALALMLAA